MSLETDTAATHTLADATAQPQSSSLLDNTASELADSDLAASELKSAGLAPGMLRSVHHIALNVKSMEAACHFYGNVLGLHKLTGDEVPATLIKLVAEGKVTNFKTPDGTILDLFWTPDCNPPAADPETTFTRADHLAFDIDPHQMNEAMARLTQAGIKFNGPVVRPTGRGIYFYDPDGFMIEVRCDPA